MTNHIKPTITIQTSIKAPMSLVWICWTSPEHITRWNFATDEWCCPSAQNDLREGGRFSSRMESIDGKMGFDFGGTNLIVETHKRIEQKLDDDRKVRVEFKSEGNLTHIIEIFEAENSNPPEMQKAGWQAILNNFKRYAEARYRLIPIRFEIEINSEPGDVFKTMIDPESYSKWIAAFDPNSKFEGSWEKGTEIRFVGTNEDGTKGGMISRIRDNKPGEYICIEHLEVIGKSAVAQTADWNGCLEEYIFKSKHHKTLLIIKSETTEQFKPYFEETWPKALDKLKSICENQSS